MAAEAVGRGGDGVGIAVEADEARGGEALQESVAVAAAAEGDVDEEAIADAAGEGRGEGGAHLLDQDRLVVAPCMLPPGECQAWRIGSSFLGKPGEIFKAISNV